MVSTGDPLRPRDTQRMKERGWKKEGIPGK